MTIKSSGSLAMSEINSEFGLGTNLNAYRGTGYYNASNVWTTFSSGAISISDFYGATHKPSSLAVRVLIVGGGGGGADRGAGDNANVNGGGGAGGYIDVSFNISPGTQYFTIGAGGGGGWRGHGGQGGDTIAFGYTAYGGGYGGASDFGPGNSGGSGGGGSFTTAGSGAPGQGNDGSYYGGGGGAGAAAPGYDGGIGAQWADGAYYAGGGYSNRGTVLSSPPPGGGGAVVGYTSLDYLGVDGYGNPVYGYVWHGNYQGGSNAATQYGGGGQAGTDHNAPEYGGGAGYQGLVVITYSWPWQIASGGYVSYSGGYYYHYITSSSQTFSW